MNIQGNLYDNNKWYFDRGIIGEVQKKIVERELSKPEQSSFLKIAVLHHHILTIPRNSYCIDEHRFPEFDLLSNGPEITEWLLQNEIALVLHGHRHICSHNQYQKYVNINHHNSKLRQELCRLTILGSPIAGISDRGLGGGERRGFQILSIDTETKLLELNIYEMDSQSIFRPRSDTRLFNINPKIKLCSTYNHCRVKTITFPTESPWVQTLLHNNFYAVADALLSEEGHNIGIYDYGELHKLAASEADIQIGWVGTNVLPTEWLKEIDAPGPIGKWHQSMKELSKMIIKDYPGFYPIRFCFWTEKQFKDFAKAEEVPVEEQASAAETLAKKHKEHKIGLIYIHPNRFQDNIYLDFALFVRSNLDGITLSSKSSSRPGFTDTEEKLDKGPIIIRSKNQTWKLINILHKELTNLTNIENGYCITSQDFKKAMKKDIAVLSWPDQTNSEAKFQDILSWISNAQINLE